MSERLNRFMLHTVADKIVGVYASPTLPIIWVGEKTPPEVVGWGRLVKVKFSDDSVSYYVQRLVKLARPTEPRWGETHIVIGGVPPTAFTPENWGWAVSDELEELKEKIDDILVPSGLGYKTIILMGKKASLEFEEVKEGELELYRPPEVYWLRLENDKVVEVKPLKT